MIVYVHYFGWISWDWFVKIPIQAEKFSRREIGFVFWLILIIVFSVLGFSQPRTLSMWLWRKIWFTKLWPRIQVNKRPFWSTKLFLQWNIRNKFWLIPSEIDYFRCYYFRTNIVQQFNPISRAQSWSCRRIAWKKSDSNQHNWVKGIQWVFDRSQ